MENAHCISHTAHTEKAFLGKYAFDSNQWSKCVQNDPCLNSFWIINLYSRAHVGEADKVGIIRGQLLHPGDNRIVPEADNPSQGHSIFELCHCHGFII